MQEYYIRKEGDEDSRGPFTLEQLVSLVEAGQVDRQTFYYDALAEKWVEIQSNGEMVATLFPVKKKLTMRSKERDSVRVLNITPTQEEKPITVEEMLAAAEGMTDETYARRDLSAELARNAMWGMRAMALMLVVSAAGLLIPQMGVLSALELIPILTSPLILIGVADLLLALLLFLEVTQIYPFVRMRAVLGLGFFLVYFLSAGEPLPALAVFVASVCLYAGTTVSKLSGVIAVAVFGLAGMGWFAYMMSA